MDRSKRRGVVACILVMVGWMELGDCSQAEQRDLWVKAGPMVAGICRVIASEHDAGGTRQAL